MERLALTRMKWPTYGEACAGATNATDCVVAQLRFATICQPVGSFDGDSTSEGQGRHLLPRQLRFSSGGRRPRHLGRLRRCQSQNTGQYTQHEFGITEIPLDWISSYLSCRFFCVRIGSSSSFTVTTNTGVPQGSILGPILFASYVALIDRLVSNIDIGYKQIRRRYTVEYRFTSPQTALNQLEMCSSELLLWFWRNDLLLNPEKSEVAFFGMKLKLLRMHLPSTAYVAGYGVAVTNILKTLGGKLNRALTFVNHVDNIARACNVHTFLCSLIAA